MDQGTEKKIIESLKEFAENKTMILVTHRNAILSMVDRVFVIENGEIISDQTPEQLGINKAKSK
jgi:ATP-binding cassette subfamily C protein LapB